jgi:hypothetical protein
MDFGSRNEDALRLWLGDRLGVEVTVPGIAIWKKDPRFGGSLDGEYPPHRGVEFKCLQKREVYWQLRQYAEAIKKGTIHLPPVGAVPIHIFHSHYDQMTMNGIITGKDVMTYVVAAAETDLNPRGGFQYYMEDLPVNHEHWNTCLHPGGVNFYETFMAPLMREHKLRRVDWHTEA